MLFNQRMVQKEIRKKKKKTSKTKPMRYLHLQKKKKKLNQQLIVYFYRDLPREAPGRKLAMYHTDCMECAETEAVGLFGSLSPLANRPLPLILLIVS
jgi:hypothetical protein